MASISLRNIGKTYPGGVKAVIDFNLEIHDKEFVVLVGPSGCGKSTTLRMIAGLEDITEGDMYINDRRINNVEPRNRDIAMVFQNYALYPYMTVFENMSFGLKLRKVPKREIEQRVLAAAKILGIEEYLDRKPASLSGGQRQRVALGRAIVREPKVFLLDEPLSNLDAKMRAQMRTEIIKLHKELQTTFVYVTHDQTEAMTMGTRIVVMKDGYIQQVDTPENLYDYPDNKFVAGFIGTPQMNIFEITLENDEDGGEEIYACFSRYRLPLPESVAKRLKLTEYNKRSFFLGVRPEDILISPAQLKKHRKSQINPKVRVVEKLGNETILSCNIGEEIDLIIRCEGRTRVMEEDEIKAALDMRHIHLFDFESGDSILSR